MRTDSLAGLPEVRLYGPETGEPEYGVEYDGVKDSTRKGISTIISHQELEIFQDRAIPVGEIQSLIADKIGFLVGHNTKTKKAA